MPSMQCVMLFDSFCDDRKELEEIMLMRLTMIDLNSSLGWEGSHMMHIKERNKRMKDRKMTSFLALLIE